MQTKILIGIKYKIKSVILYINIYVPVFVLHSGWSFEDKTCTRSNQKIKNYLYNSKRIQK